MPQPAAATLSHVAGGYIDDAEHQPGPVDAVAALGEIRHELDTITEAHRLAMGRAIRRARARHPEMTDTDLGKVLGVSKQRIGQLAAIEQETTA